MRILIIITLFLTPLAAYSFGASPEELEVQRMKDSIERIEKDMKLLQKEMFRGEAPKLSSREMKNLPSLEVRIGELEAQIRNLNGKIEEVEFNSRNALDKIDKISADIDYRLNALAKNSAQLSKTSEQNDAQKELSSQIASEPSPQQSVNKYDEAFKFLRMNKYDEAADSFKDFIDNNADSELVSNAYYWLGETFYVKENYEKSAFNFLQGYKKLPKGNKAAENLLKLALSLDKMKKKKESCATFGKLLSEFPESEKDILEKVESEKSRIGC